ncbi:MAG: GMC oxidoreductase [Paracoccaceae bacterium]
MIVSFPGTVADAFHDICIVGSGPAGISLALELERLGLSSLILESGCDRHSAPHQALSAAESYDPARHDDMRIATARRFGGASNLWGGRCQPMDAIDFLPRSGPRGASWPIAKTDLAPFHDRAAELLCCGKPVFNADLPDLPATDADYTARPQERFSNRPALQRAHELQLNRSRLITVCLDATVVEARFNGDRVISLGVRSLDGTRADIRARRFVLCCGGLESTRLLMVFQRAKPDLCGGQGGALGRYYMGHLIGEVADIRIADAALDAALDFRLDGYGSYARHRLVPSAGLQQRDGLPNVSFWPVVPPVSDASHRDGILSAVYLAFAIAPLGRLLVAEAIRKRHVPPGVSALPHIANVLRSLPRTAWHLPRLLWAHYAARMRLPGFFLRNPARLYGLSYHAEQTPDADSRVWLGDATDSLGLPRLHIDLRFSRHDADALARAHVRLDAWLQRNALGELIYRQPKARTAEAILGQAAHGTHQIGTARMAETPKNGAVDPDLRCFGSENLYLCSSAVFPTSGQCNPTFTIVALACRLAHRLSDPQAPLIVEKMYQADKKNMKKPTLLEA